MPLSHLHRSTEPCCGPAPLSGQPAINPLTAGVEDKRKLTMDASSAATDVPLSSYQHIRAPRSRSRAIGRAGSPHFKREASPTHHLATDFSDGDQDSSDSDSMNDYRAYSPESAVVDSPPQGSASPEQQHSPRTRAGSLPLFFGERPGMPCDTQRLASFTYGMPIAPCICNKHHHRRSSVAIKFKNTFMDLDEYHDPDLIIHRHAGDDADYHHHPLEGRRGLIRRPPSPIAERILKGEIDNM